MVQTPECSPLEVVPFHPKGWLPLPLMVQSKAYFISDWGYSPVVSELWV